MVCWGRHREGAGVAEGALDRIRAGWWISFVGSVLCPLVPVGGALVSIGMWRLGRGRRGVAVGGIVAVAVACASFVVAIPQTSARPLLLGVVWIGWGTALVVVADLALACDWSPDLAVRWRRALRRSRSAVTVIAVTVGLAMGWAASGHAVSGSGESNVNLGLLHVAVQLPWSTLIVLASIPQLMAIWALGQAMRLTREAADTAAASNGVGSSE